jgi:TolB-like protein
VNDALDLDINCLTVHLKSTELPDGLRLSLSGLQAIKYDQQTERFRTKLLEGVAKHAHQNAGSPPQPLIEKPRLVSPAAWGLAALVLVGVIVVATLQFSTDSADPTTTNSQTGYSPSVVDVSKPVPGFSNRAAIAVMPFINLSEDGSQEYFADGITEDLITGLQSFQSFPVIARTSTFQYKNSASDARTIASELGAGYIIEGSVRKVGNQVRINVQLNNDSGKHLWAEKFDFEYKNVLGIQDELIQKVLIAIEPKLIVTEADRARHVRTQDMQAWDYYLQAVPNTLAPWSFTNLNGQPVSHAQGELARSLLLKALQIDPQFPAAYRLLNHVESWNGYSYLQSGENEEALAALGRAINYGKLARQLSPFEPSLCSCLAADLLIAGETDSALGLQEEALRENPSNAIVHGIMAKILQVAGDYERALHEIGIAKRLAPRSMSMSYFLTWEASIHQSMGHFETAAAIAESAMLLSPINIDAQFIKIISLFAIGNHAAAKAAVEELRRNTPPDHRVFVLFPDKFPDAVAQQVSLADGRTLHGMSYQQGLDAIFAQLGWSIDRS